MFSLLLTSAIPLLLMIIVKRGSLCPLYLKMAKLTRPLYMTHESPEEKFIDPK